MYRRYREIKKKRTFFLPILIPVMNLFLLLLPFVLETSFLQKLTTHELTLPSIKSVNAENLTRRNLILEIERDGVNIQKISGDYEIVSFGKDFSSTLEKKLVEIKSKNPDITDIQIKVSYDVVYQNLIDVLDICRKNTMGFQEVVYIDEVK